ncbi:DMT family transporter, partial [Candidatus Microgenomates bacterium]|nr:DMT family transporter [Candidatus Microgenomates bacterium]
MIPGIIALIVGHFLGSAINPVFIKLAVRDIPPFMFTALRFITAAIVFYPMYRMVSKHKLSRSHKVQLVKYTLLHSANTLFYVIGIEHTTAIMSMIFYAMTPIVVGLLSHFFSHEKLTRHEVTGTAIAILGVAFLFLKSYDPGQINTFGTPFGNLMIFMAAVSLGFYYFFCRKLSKFYDPMTLSLTSYFLTGTLSVLLIPAEIGLLHRVPHFTLTSVLFVILVGTLGTALMMYLAQYGIKHTNAFIGSV